MNRARAVLSTTAVAIALLIPTHALTASEASATSAADRLAGKRQALDRAQQREGVESTELEALSTRVESLTGDVAALRIREAAVQEDLEAVQTRLDEAVSDLSSTRERLHRAKRSLRGKLVTIYKGGEVDVLTVLLDADGYDDLLSRSAYLSAIQDDGERTAQQISDLKEQVIDTVGSIRASRDEIASREADLERARIDLEAERTRLVDARARERAAIERTRTEIGFLQGDVSDLEKEVQAELREAQEAAAPESGGVAATPGAVATDSGLIWPIEGTVTSPFGPRWGTVHEGIDIGAAEGTPIAAAKSGSVVMAGWNGGYGNYTCIDHGGGFSTCYAHQLSISVSVGEQVDQGQIIGEVGNTGHSFGAHLHFETRVNGVAEDPLGYL